MAFEDYSFTKGIFGSDWADGFTALSHEGLAWLPLGKLNLGGYAYIFKNSSILQGYLNTLIYVVGATAMCMLINVTCGYALHCTTKARGFMTIFVLITAMFSGGMIPTYMVVRNLGLVGTRWSLILPGCTNAYFVMMMRAFDAVPQATVAATLPILAAFPFFIKKMETAVVAGAVKE